MKCKLIVSRVQRSSWRKCGRTPMDLTRKTLTHEHSSIYTVCCSHVMFCQTLHTKDFFPQVWLHCTIAIFFPLSCNSFCFLLHFGSTQEPSHQVCKPAYLVPVPSQDKLWELYSDLWCMSVASTGLLLLCYINLFLTLRPSVEYESHDAGVCFIHIHSGPYKLAYDHCLNGY